MAFPTSSYLQPDSFRDRVNTARQNSSLAAFNALSSSPTSGAIQNAFKDDFDDVEAFKQGSSMATTGLGWMQGMDNALQGLQAEYAAQGLTRASTAASRAEQLRADEEIYENTKKAMEDQERNGLISSIIGTGIQIASAFCERRLKDAIAPIDATRAWATVRDLPLYSFRYRHAPSLPAYGPMVDEVRQVDPSLLVPMDEAAQLMGIADGQPVYGVDIARRQVYESAALQQALQRIEELEARLAQLESPAA